ncbi:MAG: hypothetical protein QW212_00370 [Nitrososphaerales archaeon]
MQVRTDALRRIITQYSMTVGQSATKINFSQNARIVLVQNVSQNDVYFGNADVSTANGIKISAGETVPFNILEDFKLYLVANTTSEVRIMEVE